MQVGRFTIEQLNEGQFELFADGKINRTPVSETAATSITGTYDTLVGINPLYITDGAHHVLADAGLGWGLDAGSINSDVSNVKTNLEIFGVAPADITHVILTHLHYDHAAGISFTDDFMKTRPVFPNARCFVQQTEWDYAVEQAQLDSAFYKLDDIYRLYADNFFEFIHTDAQEIIPGVSVIKTGGHTPGHQIVKITDGNKSACFFGDLIPSPERLNNFGEAAKDVSRVKAKKMKVQLLKKAYQEEALLFFYHSVHAGAGKLEIDKDEKYVLKEL